MDGIEVESESLYDLEVPELLTDVFLEANKEWAALEGKHLSDIVGIDLYQKIKEKFPQCPEQMHEVAISAPHEVQISVVTIRGRTYVDLRLIIEDWKAGELWPMKKL